MNNNSDGPSNEFNSSNLYEQGNGPKGRNLVCSVKNELHPNITNGTGSHTEEVATGQNGASCSFLVSLSPSPSCLHELPLDKCNGEYSGDKCSAKGRTLSLEENGLRNHDKKRKTGCFIDSESSSGNEAEEGLSSDDCCIYTYRGDQFADLPNSFFSVDMVVNGRHQPLRENHRKANHRREAEDQDRNNLGSSPEMDYLEMDFDPGPSLEQDSEEDVIGFERKSIDSPVPELPSEFLNYERCEGESKEPSLKADTFQENKEFQPGPSNQSTLHCPITKLNEVSDCNSFIRTKSFISNCCAGFDTVDEIDQSFERTSQIKSKGEKSQVKNSNSKTCSSFGGNKVSEKVLPTVENDLNSLGNKKNEDSKTHFDGIMLWSEQEAVSKQVTLISSDVSCAATAVVNAMLVLKIRITIEKVKQGISARLKTNSSSIPQYLVSRSYAGVAHENLIRGIHHASSGVLYARFFQMYPRRDVILTRWLCEWMKKGAVPIATMNVQRDSAAEDPSLDLRHHQMIFGVNNKGIYLTSPLECLQEEELWNRLVSPSVLKIKRSEIISRWTPDCNLKPLMFQSDERWKEMNVLGQVVNVIRESADPGVQGKFLTQHIVIPASSGITLVVSRHSPAYEELASTADLPLFSNSKSD